MGDPIMGDTITGDTLNAWGSNIDWVILNVPVQMYCVSYYMMYVLYGVRTEYGVVTRRLQCECECE